MFLSDFSIRRPVVAIVASLLLVSLAHAEGGTIRGRITAGGEALAGANVQLLDSRQGSAT